MCLSQLAPLHGQESNEKFKGDGVEMPSVIVPLAQEMPLFLLCQALLDVCFEVWITVCLII
jgi:hypothetical protein